MNHTTNLELKKPEATDYYDIQNENDNMDILDAAIGALQTAVGGKAPTSHASASNTYGVGTASVYGHVKVDDAPTENSTNAVKSGGMFTALANKQNTLTFDEAPTADSDNPVKSGGVKTAIDLKQDKLHFETKSGTLSAGSTSITLTFTSETIGTDTLIDVYTGEFGVNPTAIATTSTTVTLTFDAQESAVKVAVTITN